MLEVTEKASSMLKDILSKQEAPSAVRIFAQEGCGGRALGMALDKPQENDVLFMDREIQFLIEKDLLEEVKPITLDYIETAQGAGFTLASNLPSGCGCGCSGGCG